MRRKYYIKTFGCPMNKFDSERLEHILISAGWKKTNFMDTADLIIFNTCSVRQKSEDKVYGMANKILKLKGKDSETKAKRQNQVIVPNSTSLSFRNSPVVIVTGCMARRQKRGSEIQKKRLASIEKSIHKRLSWADYIVDNNEAPKLLKRVIGKPKNISKTTALVPISHGCDNFCSYCIVPYSRGKLINRPYKDIIKDVNSALAQGEKEIFLLGQNVNSWEGNINGKYSKFPELLSELDKIKGNFWIRFTSSHPKDISDKLIDVMSKGKHITPHLHFALQSGSNKILRKMNRRYTVESFVKKVLKIRKKIPHISITTDIIVGFPGETEKDFNETVKVFKSCKFDMAYIAEYSPRPGTIAYEKWEDNIPAAIKRKRREILTRILERTCLKENMKLIGKRVKVLTYKNVKIDGKDYTTGRTDTNKEIRINGKLPTAKFITCKITKVTPWALEGSL